MISGSFWVVTILLVAAAAAGGTGYHYPAPATFTTSHSSQGSSAAGYDYRTGSNYLSPSFNGQVSHGLSGHPTGSHAQAFAVNSNQKHFTGSGLNSGYHQTGTGSVVDGGAAYNVFGTGFNYNAGASSSGSGLGTGSNNYYTTSGTPTGSNNYYGASGSSTGSNNYYGTSGSFSGSNYNTAGTGSGHQLTEYQTTFESTSDTSGLDRIGSYYQSANLHNSGSKQEYYLQNSQQPTQVFKHFYAISAPEEPKQVIRQPIVLPPPQKHYKVIFIKAPTQPAPAPQIITVPQQNEEKTIVYVLVKKPEDIKNIDLPKFEAKLPTKPEVFFVKYNDKSDSQALIDNIVKDYNKGGIKASFSNLNSGNSPAGPISIINDESSGSIDAILGSSQSSASETSGTANRFNDGYIFLNNKGSPISTGSTGTGLQSGSNAGSGSGFAQAVGTQQTAADVGSSASAFDAVNNGFNTQSLANNNDVNSFASAISNSNSQDGAKQGQNFYYPQTYKPSISFGTRYGSGSVSSGSYQTGSGSSGAVSGVPALSTLSSDSFGSSTVSNLPSASGATYDSSIVSTSQGVPHETYGVSTFRPL